ncbi:type II secretion system protein [Sedimentisphaera salicampi]|uniref:Type II secretion system protein I n=1 Tax=Sedimentisphaera salicampi TaxID=1941349 RepID=A0A1W6LP35_9BACT|nr:type II secretion system protein [Sedimentisphaera salicampi]ARN57545.1 type II secretion system protein I [Sedimentisphaera salicampi]
MEGLRKAFTLIEVLAAVVLVGIILPAAVSGISMAVRVASNSAKIQRAGILAENRLAEIRLEENWTKSQQTGDFEEEGFKDFRWLMRAEDWTDPSLLEVSITVYWGEDIQRDSIELTTLVKQETD